MTYEAQIDTAERLLRAARADIAAEIAAYPGPVSGCDAQFNHLLAERQRLTNALHALGEPVFVPTPRQPAPFARVESR